MKFEILCAGNSAFLFILVLVYFWIFFTFLKLCTSIECLCVCVCPLLSAPQLSIRLNIPKRCHDKSDRFDLTEMIKAQLPLETIDSNSKLFQVRVINSNYRNL